MTAVSTSEADFIRDIVTPGSPHTEAALLRDKFPVFGRSARYSGFLFRYMRYWIERGQQRAGLPLSDEQRGALDLLDELLAEHARQFRLGANDILWVNNRTRAHSRTAYRDVQGRRRELQRMWVRAA